MQTISISDFGIFWICVVVVGHRAVSEKLNAWMSYIKIEITSFYYFCVLHSASLLFPLLLIAVFNFICALFLHFFFVSFLSIQVLNSLSRIIEVLRSFILLFHFLLYFRFSFLLKLHSVLLTKKQQEKSGNSRNAIVSSKKLLSSSSMFHAGVDSFY